jgi:thioredoxin-related protein
MKRIAALLFAGLLASSLSAAEANWGTDLPAALAQAKKEKKLVLMDFTGSDWCPPCKALHNEVFATKEFADYAKNNLALVELDFPRFKKQTAALEKANQALQQKYHIEGYPTVILLNADGKELWRNMGYLPGGPQKFIAELDKAKKK